MALPRLSQGQVARQFLRDVLRADYSKAYGRLAPEVHRAMSPQQFAIAARPLWKSGQLRSSDIELYKLGMRLGASGGSRLFYTFTFADIPARANSLVLLEVTFRDTASRTVLAFGSRSVRTTPKPKLPAALPRKR